MTRTFIFFFLKKPFWGYIITFLSVFQTMLAQEAPPIVQCSNLAFTNTTGTKSTISWQPGNSTFSTVFIRKGTSTNSNAIPVDHVRYKANTAFGLGDQIGTSGWYCVADTMTTNAEVTGLTPGTAYQVQVFVSKIYGASGHIYYLRTVNSGNSATLTTLNNVATLSNVSLSSGALTPVFSSKTTAYTASVSNAVSSITVTPVTTDTHATIKVNGVAVSSGNPSRTIDNLEVNNVDAKANRIAIEVTAQDGTVKTYTIKVLRLSAPPTIQATNLTFTKTTATTTTVDCTNGNGNQRMLLMRAGTGDGTTPVPDNLYFRGSTIFGLGDQISTTGWCLIRYGSALSDLEVQGLAPGTTYQVMVMEFIDDGGDYPSYLTTTSTGNPATVTTPLSNVATLSNLGISSGALDPVFSSGTTDYMARVSNAASSITVTPVTTDTHATIKVNGVAVTSGNPSQTIDNLEVNNVDAKANRIAIEVTAQDGTVKT
ncbi:cadherin-like beta sandwich domain-containing protein, partial [Flavobacterium sp. UGB4466]|uniref:cadherin-like beta sandwich domain-containing protein n=1 Tax=Flavobacterium sp. UGB4466 TaxID=2730889 RepID=UPI00192C6FD4